MNSREKWKIQEIKNGLKEADRGEFATDEQINEVFDKWLNPYLEKFPNRPTTLSPAGADDSSPARYRGPQRAQRVGVG